MTVVAGVVRDGQVWMAADEAANDGMLVTYNQQKIRKLRIGAERILIGFGGDSRLIGHAARAVLGITPGALEQYENDEDEAANHIADEITRRLMELPLPPTRTEDHDVRGLNGGGLIGFRGSLYYLEAHAALRTDGIAAIGSGDAMTLGALHALLGSCGTGSVVALQEAVMIACRYSPDCRLRDGALPAVWSI